MRKTYDYFGENELINKLPPPRSKKEYLNVVENSPFISEDMKKLSALERSMMVSGIKEFRIARDFGYAIDWRIAMALRKGYMLSIKNEENNGEGSTERYRKREDDTSAFILYGPSGVGKTTTLNTSLAYYKQVIEHKGKDYNFKQLVYIKVECPPADSFKSFLDSCLDEMEKALNMKFEDRIYYRTADQKEELFKNLANRWNLGLLVIDEIQNLLSIKKNVLMNQFLKLTNELGVPIIYVGTDKFVEYMEKAEFFTVRRFGVQIAVEAYKKDILWNHMMNELWKNQWMQEYVPLTQELNDVFYEETKGVISRVIDLFSNAQVEAILQGIDTVDNFTPEFIRFIAKNYFGIKGNMRASVTYLNIEDQKMLQEEFEATKDSIVDVERANEKGKKESLKNRIMTNVIKGSEILPYSFKQTEIKDVIKEVFKQKNILEQDEIQITKLVVSKLIDRNNINKKHAPEEKKTLKKISISMKEFPRFDGVI